MFIKGNKLISSVFPKKNALYFLSNSKYYTDRGIQKIAAVKPVYIKTEMFLNRKAIIDINGVYRYGDLIYNANRLVDKILSCLNVKINEFYPETICTLCSNNSSFIISQFACHLLESMQVPLYSNHPQKELEYFIKDSESKLIITTPDLTGKVESIAKENNLTIIELDENEFRPGNFEVLDISTNLKSMLKMHSHRNRLHIDLMSRHKLNNRNSLMLYTSGTTGRPKGVIHTFRSLETCIRDMGSVWNWNKNDVILHCLPLHHYHGIVNCLMTPLYYGACCVMMPKFDPIQVWRYILNQKRLCDDDNLRINVFMAVPMIYAKLIECFDKMTLKGRKGKLLADKIKRICKNEIRLMCSGSASLPTSIMNRWEEITGHRLLERYGMTETGMVLTNGYELKERIAGTVGTPFPSVDVAIVDNKGDFLLEFSKGRFTKISKNEEIVGELYVDGPNLFKKYWNRPNDTECSKSAEGWFKTGDIVKLENKRFKILGRSSMDIIKSRGFKISALDIEWKLLNHKQIKDVSVFGMADEELGEKIVCLVVLKTNTQIKVEDLKKWCKGEMPYYHIPEKFTFVDVIEKNAMGKVNKKQLRKYFET